MIAPVIGQTFALDKPGPHMPQSKAASRLAKH
jgi:hypothetical protein